VTQLALRQYQVDAINRTLEAEKRGIRKQLGVAATGLGKTIVFASLARRMNCRTLVLAHRDELVSQAVDKIRGQWPEASIGIVKAELNQVDRDVVVASVQTLARPNRLRSLIGGDGFFARQLFGLVVADEAHHYRSEQWGAVLKALRAGEPDGPLLLGVTATPDRGDGLGLSDVFDEVTWSYDILWGIRSGYLCDVRGKRVTIDTLDLKGVRTRHGDYAEGDLGARLMNAGAPAAIARAWMEHASDRRTIVFTPTVATADAVAWELAALGVSAAMVSGKTPLDERRKILADFESGAVQVVANCAVLTEGYDNPRVDCIVVARPTKSRALYTQMVGRGTRRHPDKKDLLVLDVVGVSEEHSLITVPSLFGITDAKARKKLSTGELGAVEVLDELEEELVRVGKIRAEDVELFHKVRSEIAWVAVHETGGPRRYERSMGKDRDGTQRPTVRLVQLYEGEDRYTCSLRVQGPQGGSAIQALIVDVPLETAQAVGEDWIRAQGGLGLVASNAPWRAKAPSPKAAGFARSLGVFRDGMTAGECSDAIDAKMAQRRTTGRRN
jgi:superfamily II DNA or RNA helicase